MAVITGKSYRIASGGRRFLVGAGSVNHKKAIDKAKSEYRKY